MCRKIKYSMPRGRFMKPELGAITFPNDCQLSRNKREAEKSMCGMPKFDLTGKIYLSF